MQGQNLPAPRQGGKGALIAKFADKFGVDQGKLINILKATCFKQAGRDAQPVTDEQMAALLVVADQYNLNPFTREIYAFPDKGKGIVPIVGVDGWSRIINEHPALDGLEFRNSETVIQADDDAKPCPEWIEVVVHRKDRSRPTVIREYLDECYRPAFSGRGQNGDYKVAGPWQTHTKRFLRHKALIQGARVAFGFAGVYDEDEAERIVSARVVEMNAGMPAAIDVGHVDACRFDDLAEAKGADKAALARFVSSAANTNGVSPDDLKAQAAEHFDEFWEAFQNWQARSARDAATGKKTAKKQPEPAKEPEAAPVATCPKTDSPINPNECPDCVAREGCPALED